MKSKLVFISPQESFPSVDLSDDNTAIIELILQNTAVLTDSHRLAENSLLLYPTSHVAVKSIGTQATREYMYASMDLGATIYEATAALVKPQLDLYADTPELSAEAMLAGVSSIPRIVESEQSLVDTLTDARDQMLDECPNLSYVIAEVSRRNHTNITEVAIASAGIMRGAELAAKRHFTS